MNSALFKMRKCRGRIWNRITLWWRRELKMYDYRKWVSFCYYFLKYFIQWVAFSCIHVVISDFVLCEVKIDTSSRLWSNVNEEQNRTVTSKLRKMKDIKLEKKCEKPASRWSVLLLKCDYFFATPGPPFWN